MDEEKLYVKKIICGKKLGMKRLDIKGRSRMGIIRSHICSIKIELEEKNIQDFYKMVIKGEAPP